MIADRRAMPVMIPGRAMGRMMKRLSVFFPKKLVLQTAAAARVPTTRATTVEIAATRSERPNAALISEFCQATPNQSVVNPGGGKRKLADSVVKA